MSFGEKLKSLRLEKIPPITQTDLASVLGVTQRKISFLETDTSEPSLKDLADICIYFNVSADYFLELPSSLAFPNKHD